MDTAGDSPVPIVDYDLFLHGSAEERRTAASQMDEAFRAVGFVILLNHGIAQAKVDECFEWSKKFFALPTPIKLLAPHPPGGAHHRGYSSLSREKVSQKNVFDDEGIAGERAVPDFKESFESGNVEDGAQPNIWLPDQVLPGFRPFMERFFEDCASLVHTVLETLALSLGLPPSIDLPSTHARSLFQLRLLHYPSIALHTLLSNEKTRISAHSDFGTLTLLFQDQVGGLEVEILEDDGNGGRKGSGLFKGVPCMEGGVLVNVGDLLMRWSNDRWKSMVHRVGAPPASLLSHGNEAEENVICPPRYSIPFFASVDPDTVVECLPGCWGPGNPKKYESVKGGEYLQMRMTPLY